MTTAFELAVNEIGTFEWAEGSNPRVVAYFKDAGHPEVVDDSTAWCAAFVGAMLKRSGLPNTGKLTARSYQNWGSEVPLSSAQQGDIVVFWRGTPDGWQGHVGFFVRQEGDQIITLGGNQRDQVCQAPYPVSKLLSVRRLSRQTRKAPVQSTTVQASAVQVASAAGAGVSAVAGLDGNAQMIALAFCGVIALMALWIMRERLRKWAGGDR